MIKTVYNVCLDKSEAHPGHDVVWEYNPREENVPAYYANTVNGQRITLSRDADKITDVLMNGNEPMKFGTADPRVVGLEYNTTTETGDIILSINTNTLNTRFISDIESELPKFHINQTIDYGPYGLVYINVNRKDYKVISYRTAGNVDTINTYRYKNFIGMLISVHPDNEVADEAVAPILDIVLKDLSTNKFVRYAIDYDMSDDGILKITEESIGGKKSIMRYKEFDNKFRNGARFKVRFNSYSPDKEAITCCEMVWNPDLNKLKGSAPNIQHDYQESVPEFVTNIGDINGLTESDWVKIIGDFIENMSGHLSTKVNAITINGFDIPRGALYQLKQLVYLFKVDEENNRYVTIKSR